MPAAVNPNQPGASDGALLDATQYQMASIDKYEAIYGKHFVSPGGIDSARKCIAGLGLRPGMLVLDLGCGLGGAAFCMAREHGVQVHGIDVSANMIQSAQRRLHDEGLQGQVTFERQDVMGLEPLPRYHVVYSRDVFLHIHQKERLLALLRRLLLPGGLLFFTDYCRGEGTPSAAFSDYIAQRHYDLRTVREYQQLLDEAGFRNAQASDRTTEFIAILQAELERIADDAAHAEIRQSWLDKIERARSGEQGWCWCRGEKP